MTEVLTEIPVRCKIGFHKWRVTAKRQGFQEYLGDGLYARPIYTEYECDLCHETKEEKVNETSEEGEDD